MTTAYDLAHVWDENAAYRLNELSSGKDSAYLELTDLILSLVSEVAGDVGAKVLDIGCGLGFLSAALAQRGYEVTGIDASSESIRLAKEHFSRPTFRTISLHDFALEQSSPSFAACIANMVMHGDPNERTFSRDCYKCTQNSGLFIATIPHPAFRRGKQSDTIPEYTAPSELWTTFRIHNGKPHPSKIPWFHRPISDYSEALYAAGYRNIHIAEPPQIGEGRPHDVLVLSAER